MSSARTISAVMATGLAGAGLVAVAAAAPAGAAARPAARPAAAARQAPARPAAGENARSTKCRKASSSISGAKAWGTLCWNPDQIFANGYVRDSKADGKYAAFRVQFRYWNLVKWQTVTTYIRTTKGYKSPKTLSIRNWTNESGYKMKDFWMQVCKQGGSHRTCDGHWH
ncbi:hypothetical protein [Actinomadura violacea]|uniref:Secreted protein n=1 Tax=Actinomadura violacea TaxID=2819934 RepID=A0ABS3RZD6_9ACTN|nr:hypothetical protein [Actinomadura violacea]MBO2462124.1 hypothetical protein [Actinomadura violacea]